MTNKTPWPTTADGKYLVLRTVSASWTSRGGFKWRKTVETVAPDWDPNPDRDCGGGLHGLLWGCGGAGYLSSATDAIWLVVAVDPADVANPDQPSKVRFRAGKVVRHGTRDEATAFLIDHGGYGLPIVYATVTGGDMATVTGGDWATVTGGDWATVTGGDEATVTGGDMATVTGGDEATVTGGCRAILQIRWWGGVRWRIATAYVGEDGIKANTPYRLDGTGNFVEAT